jgi:hypothetical protein
MSYERSHGCSCTVQVPTSRCAGTSTRTEYSCKYYKQQVLCGITKPALQQGGRSGYGKACSSRNAIYHFTSGSRWEARPIAARSFSSVEGENKKRIARVKRVEYLRDVIVRKLRRYQGAITDSYAWLPEMDQPMQISRLVFLSSLRVLSRERASLLPTTCSHNST